MLFFVLLTSAIPVASQKFCVCRPDRPGQVCTLQMKCQSFSSESEIIIPSKDEEKGFKSTVNFVSSSNDDELLSTSSLKDSSIIVLENGVEEIELEVFGSFENQQILLNFSRFNGKNIHVSGGEFQQYVKIVGMAEYKKENMFSLKTKNIFIEFDKNSIHFDRLDISNSFLRGKSKAKLNISANTISGDTKSLTTNYFLHSTQSFIENSDLNNDINKQKDPKIDLKSVKIENKDIIKSEHREKKTREIKNTLLLENSDNFTSYIESLDTKERNKFFSFCVASKSNLERVFADEECKIHNVPHDMDHYVNIRSDLSFIHKAPKNQVIKFFVTSATLTDQATVFLPVFINCSVAIVFQRVSQDISTYLSIRKNTKTIIQSNDNSDSNPDSLCSGKNISISIANIDQVRIETKVFEIISNLVLKETPFQFFDITDSSTETLISYLSTDSKSISKFVGKLLIEKKIELTTAPTTTMAGRIVLLKNAKLHLSRSSLVPKIFLYKSTIENSYPFYFTLFDSDDDYEMNIYFGDNNVTLVLEDQSTLLTNPISLTFDNYAYDENSIFNPNYTSLPFINITTVVPKVGAVIDIGSKGKPFLNNTIFQFEGSSAFSPIVNISFNDYSVDSIERYEYFIFHFVDIIVANPESFDPYIDGISKKYVTCLYDKPDFANRDNPSCYQIGSYDVNIATLDIKGDLEKLYFYKNKAINFTKRIDPSKVAKIPSLFKNLNLLTSKTEEVMIDIEDNLLESDIQHINIATYKSSNGEDKSIFRFAQNFSKYENNPSATSKIQISHHTSDIELRSESQTIPLVTLDDPVEGVIYSTAENQNGRVYVTGDFIQNKTNTRFGPNITVKISSGTKVPQQAFLGQEVNFSCADNNKICSMNLIYWRKSVCKYSFSSILLSFSNSSNWNKGDLLAATNNDIKNVQFKAKSLILDEKSKISHNINENGNLTFDLDELIVGSIDSLPKESFSSPISVNKRFSISDNTIKQIIFTGNSVRLVNNNNKETIQIRQSTDLNVNKASSENSGFLIETKQKEKIILSVEGKEGPRNCKMSLSGGNIMLDKSWNNVDISDTFEVTSSGNLLVQTDLMSLPGINISINSGKITIEPHKMKLTDNLGFYVFIAIFGVILIVCLIFCIVGLCGCISKEEEFDVSSSDTNCEDILLPQEPKNNFEKSTNDKDENKIVQPNKNDKHDKHANKSSENDEINDKKEIKSEGEEHKEEKKKGKHRTKNKKIKKDRKKEDSSSGSLGLISLSGE